jgi:glycosyltransferase involved in cell wall biosynthesis
VGADIVFDVSHLITRLTQTATTGIDRVDLAYARHFLGYRLRPSMGTQYGLRKPHILGPGQTTRLLTYFEQVQREHETTDNADWMLLLSRLAGSGTSVPSSERVSNLPCHGRWVRSFARQTGFRIFWDWKATIPEGAIYLSVAQHAFEHDRFFRWLDKRPDVRPVFFVHDLLPLDFPEFFPTGYQERFLRRVRTMRRASALVTSSQSVAARVRNEFEAHGHHNVRIHVEPLPSPLENSPSIRSTAQISVDPYFLMIGTIEPRKNHDLLLHVWRTLADRANFRARLVLVGNKGW